MRPLTRYLTPPNLLTLAIAATLGTAAPAHCQDPAPRVIRPPTAKAFQAALDTARPGDTIKLQPAVNYDGNFRLRKKAGADTARIIIETDSLPLGAGRLTLLEVPRLAALRSPNSACALDTDYGASHYTIRQVAVTTTGPHQSNCLVALGEADARNHWAGHQVEDVTLDRIAVHGWDRQHVKRGVELNSGAARLTNSLVYDIHAWGQDAQAVDGWNGRGPYDIENNWLEASGENILFGGADPRWDSLAVVPRDSLVPTGIRIVGNRIDKPLRWRDSVYRQRRTVYTTSAGRDSVVYTGDVYVVKTLLELKAAQRVLIEGNLFVNSWTDGQSGHAWLFAPVNQNGGCGWCRITDVTAQYNRVVRAGRWLTVSGGQTYGRVLPDGTKATIGPSRGYRIAHNVVELLGADRTGDGLPLLLGSGVEDLTIDSNTVRNTTSRWAGMLGSATSVLPGLRIVGNETGLGVYAWHGFRTDSLYRATGVGVPFSVLQGNLFVGAPRKGYPASNKYIASWTAYDSLAARGQLPLVAGADTTPRVTWAYSTRSVPDSAPLFRYFTRTVTDSALVTSPRIPPAPEP